MDSTLPGTLLSCDEGLHPGSRATHAPRVNQGSIPSKAVFWASLSIGALVAYLNIVILLNEVLLGHHIRLVHVAVALLAVYVLVYHLLQWARRHGWVSHDRLQNVAALSAVSLISLMAADIGYTLYSNNQNINTSVIENQRLTDRHLWTTETHPRRYFPTEKDFMIYKANVRIEYEAYGDLYHPAVLKSPQIAELFRQPRRVAYSIDQHGFRNSTPPGQARMFALGDSFAFGVSVTDGSTWASRLEDLLGQPVYNLGISGNSPQQQLMILEYILDTQPYAANIRHLLWLIFEGNDLEDLSSVNHPVPQLGRLRPGDALRHTVIDSLASIPLILKEQSIIDRIIKGRLSLAHPWRTEHGSGPYMVDGIRLLYPLFYSPRFGYKLFYPTYIETARKGQSYILTHPNRQALDQTFEDMASLSRRYGFKTTVIIAPSAPRLYGTYYENFPRISAEPYFINYVQRLSRSVAFDVINLYQFMKPYAREELLYWRDDTHWNDRGHELVAEIIANHFHSSTPRLNASRLTPLTND